MEEWPISGAIEEAEKYGLNVTSLGTEISELMEYNAGPLLSQLPAFFNLPYPARGDRSIHPTLWEGFLHFLLGGHPWHPPSAYDRRQIERSERRAENQ